MVAHPDLDPATANACHPPDALKLTPQQHVLHIQRHAKHRHRGALRNGLQIIPIGARGKEDISAAGGLSLDGRDNHRVTVGADV